MSEPADLLAPYLQQLRAGEAGALDRLCAAAYPELCRLARSRLFDGGRPSGLGTTVLVHETYLRLRDAPQLQPEHRRAFFAYASQVMRTVIVTAVRERQALRRGGELQRLTLDTALGEELGAGSEEEVLQVHEALQVLAEAEPRLAEVVALRYFGGHSEVEIAELLGQTERTVRRDWSKAKLLLASALRG
jgi:RNA polymerase sigma factor (TIGR02999 family)